MATIWVDYNFLEMNKNIDPETYVPDGTLEKPFLSDQDALDSIETVEGKIEIEVGV